MVADPIHARRPALPAVRRRILAALLCAPLALWPIFTTSASASAQPASTAQVTAATATDDDTVTIGLTPSASSILHIDQPLQLTVTVTNDTATAIPAGTVDVFLAERALTTRAALDDWLDPDEDSDAGELMTSVPLTAPVLAHSTVSLAVSVPSTALGLFEWSPWGPRGIAASLTVDDTVRAAGQSTFVWYPDTGETPPTVTPVNLAVAMPITTTPNSTGLISAEDLTAFTADSGILTRQLDGVIDRPVAIAIDPMIIASIRVLGSSAPASAVDWLNRLSQATNDIFPLGYADADPSLATQAGAAGPLEPTSLDFATDPALFVPTEPAAPPAGEEQGADPNIPTPTSTEDPQPGDEGTAPTLGQLLAWDYTTTNIAWPADNVVAQSDLSAFSAAGLTSTILASGNVSSTDTSSTDASSTDTAVASSATIDLGSDAVGLVADTGISQALRNAITATTDASWRAAMAELSSQVAVVAAANPDEAVTLLATLDRGWPPTAARLSQTIDSLANLPWFAATTLTTAAATPVSTDVTFVPQAEPAASVDLAGRLIDRETEIVDFAGALATPIAVTAPNRLALLALLATSWGSEPSDWRTAVGANLAASHALLRSVTVSTTGPINVVGSKVDIPITLTNGLNQAATVRVQVVPSNGRLVVGNDVETVIDANSAKTVSIPVTAAVGNGAVTLRVTLFTPSGTAVDQPSLISVNVRADWEGIGSRIFAALVVLFFGFGIWRNIVHRRRDRVLAAQADADPDADLDAGTDAPPTGPVDTLPAPPATTPTEPDDQPAAPRG
ncbi:DUF6049 family protein [Cryobacterium sp. SO2]|uniref:DUF6049 family protein n=1 Tax=Cryobacterium sp. SO2 TaxID=1897060 RepID=UPI00223D5497|nr:DUF6049 family protein [Cryobacterium sp. SO2]WEO77471.1 DUF6049 family protein [Cryobacterium sp. SO2]